MRLVLITMIVVFGTKSFSQEYGIGGVIGSPTGISGSVNLEAENSLAWALAYNLSRYSGLHLHADYLWNNQRTFQIKSWDWNMYYGVGGRLVDTKHDDEKKIFVGVRAPIGVTHKLADPSVMLFGELVPVLNIAPRTDVFIDVGIGARFMF